MIVRGDRDRDTVCAVSTPHGVGGISVIRISGPKALEITLKSCSFLKSALESHKIYFGFFKDSQSGNAVDEVLISYFAHGRSFTGEEVLEISCHGSPTICQAVLNSLIAGGARAADRGEFTYRAFMNGKLDLVQAESVLSLIESQSAQAAQLALRQLKGTLSDKLLSIEDQMTWILAHAEAGIDFSTEDITILENEVVIGKLNSIQSELRSIVGTFNAGRIVKDGIKVVLTGLPNVGKSSLLNLFLENDRAIVTNIPGTTRDTIEGDSSFNGIKFTFVDTAGLRDEASDLVEQIGIQKSLEATQDSDIVLFVFDSQSELTEKERSILSSLDPTKTYFLGNKSDISKSSKSESLVAALKGLKNFTNIDNIDEYLSSRLFFVSALDKTTRDVVLGSLESHFLNHQRDNSVLLSNTRHFENLSKALENTTRALGVVNQGLGLEFLAFEFKEALICVQETLGKRFDDQIMDRVFKEFCIGK